jgi:glycosyltransferase involved in cell wall biosynthesis
MITYANRLINLKESPVLSFASVLNTSRPIVLITGPFGLPGSGAAAEHAFNVARVAFFAGYSPLLLPFSDDGRREDLEVSGRFYSWKGMPYMPAGDCTTDGSSKLETLKTYTGKRAPVLDMLRRADLSGVCAVISLKGHIGFCLRLRDFCRRKRIGMISEEVEWHDRRYSAYTLKWVSLLDMELRIRCAVPLSDGVIGISRYFERYYRGRGCRFLRLPPVLDTHDPRWKKVESSVPRKDRLKLVMFGSVIRDRQDLIIGAVARARAQGVNVSIEYVGRPREEIFYSLGPRGRLIEELGGAVVFHGWVDEDRLRSIIDDADFGVLFREDARWSKACFPSRVPEYLSCGVPLICNTFSDLGEYLHDGQNAIIVPDLSDQALASAMIRAAGMNAETRLKMRDRARHCAEENFDVRKHAGPFGEFVGAVTKYLYPGILPSSRIGGSLC